MATSWFTEEAGSAAWVLLALRKGPVPNALPHCDHAPHRSAGLRYIRVELCCRSVLIGVRHIQNVILAPLLFAPALLGTVASADAQSWCRHASRPDERLICKDAYLSQL